MIYTPDTIEQLASGRYRVSWTSQHATPGTPMVRGVLQLEHHPDLHPLEARGYGADPGEYWRLQYHPAAWSALSRPRRTLTATPFRIEQGELPEWADHRDVDAFDRQWDLCRRMWARANARPYALRKFKREVTHGLQVSGFYLGELVGSSAWLHLDGEACARSYTLLDLPAYRAPWSIIEWIVQREVVVGVVVTGQQTDSATGGRGPWRTVIPASKLIHLAAEEVGFNPEGVSSLRPIYNNLQRLLDLDDAASLNVELYATGELFFEDTLGTLQPNDKARLEQYIATRRAAHAPGGVLPKGVRPNYSAPSSSMPDLTPLRGAELQAVDRATDAEHRGIAEAGNGGAYAARSEAAADARDGLDYYAEDWIGGALERWFEAAIRINFPHDVAAGRLYLPVVRWGVVEERDMNTWVSTVVQAKDSGLLDHPLYGPILADQLDLPAPATPAEGAATPAEGAAAPGDAPDIGAMMDPKALGALLAVAPATLVRLVKTGVIPGAKIGSRWRVSVQGAKDYLRAQSQRPQA